VSAGKHRHSGTPRIGRAARGCPYWCDRRTATSIPTPCSENSKHFRTAATPLPSRCLASRRSTRGRVTRDSRVLGDESVADGAIEAGGADITGADAARFNTLTSQIESHNVEIRTTKERRDKALSLVRSAGQPGSRVILEAAANRLAWRAAAVSHRIKCCCAAGISAAANPRDCIRRVGRGGLLGATILFRDTFWLRRLGIDGGGSISTGNALMAST
jgi:hypothetical protein